MSACVWTMWCRTGPYPYPYYNIDTCTCTPASHEYELDRTTTASIGHHHLIERAVRKRNNMRGLAFRKLLLGMVLLW